MVIGTGLPREKKTAKGNSIGHPPGEVAAVVVAETVAEDAVENHIGGTTDLTKCAKNIMRYQK